MICRRIVAVGLAAMLAGCEENEGEQPAPAANDQAALEGERPLSEVDDPAHSVSAANAPLASALDFEENRAASNAVNAVVDQARTLQDRGSQLCATNEGAKSDRQSLRAMAMHFYQREYGRELSAEDADQAANLLVQMVTTGSLWIRPAQGPRPGTQRRCLVIVAGTR